MSGGQFVLDGHPLQLISGEMHYARIPREYWRDRMRKARAMGLNAISTYVFWNVHEPMPGQYNFSGQYDVAEFVREAHQEGLYVLLRPGPYVCSEWDLGGLPAWLLANGNSVLRSTDPRFIQAKRNVTSRDSAKNSRPCKSRVVVQSWRFRSRTNTVLLAMLMMAI